MACINVVGVCPREVFRVVMIKLPSIAEHFHRVTRGNRKFVSYGENFKGAK
jgi:hypothetical protein